jgi:Dolichyl-phosphate-mannose-protein mannosyltransferase
MTKPATPSAVPAFWKNTPHLALWTTLLLALVTRLQLLSLPLERDEGGFAYIGSRLWSGDLLYRQLLDNKLPALYGFYGLFQLLPGAPEVKVHLGLLLVHAGTLWLFYRLSTRLADRNTAAWATALLALSALMPGVYGFAAHATQLMLLPLMGGLILLHKVATQPTGAWWQALVSGCLVGLAFTVKQPAIVFMVFGGLALLLEPKAIVSRLVQAAAFSLGCVLPYGAIALYFMGQGRFQEFWRWTYEVPASLSVTGDAGTYLSAMLPIMVGNNGLFWAVSLLSVVALFFVQSAVRRTRLWVMALFGLSLASTAIGLGFIPHYFVPVLPWCALGIALVGNHLSQRSAALSTGTMAVLLVSMVLFNSAYFIRPNHLKIMDQCYHWNGFPELKAIGAQLKKRLKPGETLAVLGSEPQLYLYSGATACSPHLYMYPVLRDNPWSATYQQELVCDLDACQAQYLVVTSSEASWVPNFAQQDFFKTQIMPRINQQYQLIGRANIGQMPMSIVWDEGLKNHKAPQVPPILVFKRK